MNKLFADTSTRPIRHGDVLLRRVDSLPSATGGTRKDREKGPDNVSRVILAYGEVTGHSHAIADAGAFVISYGNIQTVDRTARGMSFESADEYLVVEAESVELGHEEHDTIVIPAGTYQIVHQREYTPESIRNVAD